MDDGVVAGAAVDDVVAATATQAVVLRVASQRVVVAGARDSLDVAQRVKAAQAVGHHRVARLGQRHRDGGTRAEIGNVVTCAAVDGVVAGITPEVFVCGAAYQRVAALAAPDAADVDQGVGFNRSPDGVVRECDHASAKVGVDMVLGIAFAVDGDVVVGGIARDGVVAEVAAEVGVAARYSVCQVVVGNGTANQIDGKKGVGFGVGNVAAFASYRQRAVGIV